MTASGELRYAWSKPRRRSSRFVATFFLMGFLAGPHLLHAQEDATLVRARALLGNGHFDEAADSFRAALRRDSTGIAAWAGLAAALHRSERYVDALVAVDRAVQIDPGAFGPRFNRALTYSELGRVQHATAELDTAISLRSDFAPAFTERGAARALLQRFEEAEEDWHRSLTLDSTYVWPHFYRALAAIARGSYRRAADDLDIVLRSQDLLSAHLWRWVAYRADGRAAPPLPAAGDAWPGPIAAHLRGEIPEAELLADAREQQFELDERRVASALYFIAQKHLADGRTAQGRHALERLLQMQVPRHAEVVAAEMQLRRLPN